MDEKEIPGYVIARTTSTAPTHMKEEIKQNVRNYVNGDLSSETGFEGDLEAQSRNPLDFKIEGQDMTFRDLIDVVYDIYDLMVECRSIYDSKDVTTRADCFEMDMEDVKSDIPPQIVEKIGDNLRKLPKGYRRGFAMHQRTNSPVAGFVLKEIYKNRVKNNSK